MVGYRKEHASLIIVGLETSLLLPGPSSDWQNLLTQLHGTPTVICWLQSCDVFFSVF